MKRIRVDFLIVGAGLAGSVAGFLLKKAGADVLALELLDAKTKEKLCGGIMNKRALTQVAEVFGEGTHRVGCLLRLTPQTSGRLLPGTVSASGRNAAGPDDGTRDR